MKSYLIMEFILLMVIYDVGAAKTKTPLPVMQCPVGTSLDSAFFFGITLSSPASASMKDKRDKETEARTRFAEYKGKTRDQLRTILKDELGITDPGMLSDEELINRTSIYRATQKFISPSPQPHKNPLVNRARLENYLLGQLTGEDKRWFRLFGGFLKPQDLTLLACDAEAHLPEVSVYYGNHTADGSHCYTEEDNKTPQIQKFSEIELKHCPLHCRSKGLRFTLQSSSDAGGCYCTDQALKGRKVCDGDRDYKLFSTGLGFAPVSFTVTPTDSPTEVLSYNTAILGSQFVKFGGNNLNVVLMGYKLSVFRIEDQQGQKYPDADDDNAPQVELLDYRTWKSLYEEQTVVDKWDPKSKEFLEPKREDDILGIEGSKFVKSERTEASSMTIAAIFVQLNETLIPDEPIDYDNVEKSPDYDDDAFKGSNMAARPIPGGKWYYHIIIVHKSKARMLSYSPPVMSVLRIMEDGSLIHLLTKEGGGQKGQFQNPENLMKDVTSMTSISIGRQSYLITSSSSINSAIFPHEKYSVVEVFRLQDSEAPVTLKFGKIGCIEPVRISEPVQTFFAEKVVKVDFYSHVFVAILDRVNADDIQSRVRVFKFNPDSSSASQVLNLEHEFSLEAGKKYTALHSFERKGLQYLSVSRQGRSIIFKVAANGALEKISEVEGDDLTELIPVATGRARQDVNLVQFGKSGNNIIGKRLHPLTYPFTLDQAAVVSEPLWNSASDQGTFALQSMDSPTSSGVMGVHLGLKDKADNGEYKDIGFQIFMFPEVPEFYLDRRLQKEAELYPRLYSIPKVDSTINKNVVKVRDELAKYVQKSGSVVEGNWEIKNVETAKMTTVDLPTDTVVTLRLKDNATDLTTEDTTNFRQIFNLKLTNVESKLAKIKKNFGILDGRTSDLLLKKSSEAQTVNTPMVFADNLVVSGELKLAKSNGGKIKMGSLKNLDEKHTVALEDLTKIYSTNQNKVPISGKAIFKDMVDFTNGVKTSTLSDMASAPTVSINLDNALRYSGGQTIPSPQAFKGPVQVEGNVALEAGIGLSKGDLKLVKADIPYDNAAVAQKINFAKVTVEDPGVTAPNFSDLPASLVESMDHVAPKAAANVHIKGKLKIVPDTADVDSFIATGNRIGLVKDKVNKHDISDLYDNAAWLRPPASLPDITSKSVIKFKASFNTADQLKMDQMPPNNLNICSEQKEDGSCLNNIPLSEFVRKANDGGVYNIGGDKTFANITNVGEIVAKTFNGKTLNQFVNKKDEQNISKHAKFNAGFKVKDIVGHNNRIPLVDTKNLTEYFNDNVAVLLAMEKNKHFNTLTIGSGAKLKIDNKINSYNLKERTDKIVRADVEEVEISGDKTVEKAASLGPVKVGKINTAYKDDTYGKSYVVDDFVNIKNAQTIPAGKTFSGSVTLGDVSFLGAEADIVTGNGILRAPPLTNCFIDVNSGQDFVEVDRKVSFEALTTNHLQIAKGYPKCSVGNTLEDAVNWIGGTSGSEAQNRQALINYLESEYPGNKLDFPHRLSSWLITETYMTKIIKDQHDMDLVKYHGSPITEKLVASLPSLGPYFSVSFEMWVDKFHSRVWTEVLRFTATGKNCCNPGDRIPAFFVNKNGHIHVTSQVGTGNLAVDVSIKLKTWVKVEVKQYVLNAKTMYEVIVDGKSARKVENKNPIKYENVHVWTGRAFYPNLDGIIRNFKFSDAPASVQIGQQIVSNYTKALLFKLYGAETAGMTDLELVQLYCRDPNINDVSPSDLALLDGNNDFCSGSSCTQTFKGGFEVASLEVNGNLDVQGNTVFGVNVPYLESSRVSLTRDQTLNGIYHIQNLNVDSKGFSGDILYHYEGRNQSLYGMCDKLLLSTSKNAQTFTKARAFSQLSASNSVSTGTGSSGDLKSVNVGKENFNIKNLYDTSYKLDQVTTITSTDFKIKDELKVSKDIEVTGTVETVDIVTLAGDIVVDADSDLEFTAPDGAKIIVSSNSKSVSVPSKKTFSKPLTVSNNIATSGHLVVTAGDTALNYTSEGLGGKGFVNRILKKNGDTQTVSTNINLDGNVKIEGNLIADSIDGVAFSDITAKYEYNSGDEIHEVKTKFNFSGSAITVSDLETASVRGRKWSEFVGDIIPVPCSGDKSEPITANRLVATLPSLGPYFDVSLDVWVDNFQPNPKHHWSELIRFTSTKANCCNPGDRIPAIFVNKAGLIHITSQVGAAGNYYTDVHIKSKTWVKVEVKQYAENGKTMYELIVDGKSARKVENTAPTKYENVKVWTGASFHPAVDGSIRNLKLDGLCLTDLTASITGEKTFSGSVKLHLDDTVLGTFNDVDLGATYTSQAFIDEDTSFPVTDSFTTCAPGWTYSKLTGNCYKYDKSKSSWKDAQAACQSSSPSSTLASVHDKKTNDFLANLSGGSERTWLGGYQDKSEAWLWDDGSKWTGFTNWGQNQPDNPGKEPYLQFNWNAPGLWNDDREHAKYSFICQYYSSLSSVVSAPSLRAKSSLRIPASIVKTDAGSDINLEKLYQNTILKSSDKTVSVMGSLIFNKDVTLKADSTIGSLDDEADSPIQIPEDLILTDATDFSGSPVHSCVNLKTGNSNTANRVVHQDVATWEKCAEKCHQSAECNNWSWVSKNHVDAELHFDCYLFTGNDVSTIANDHVSGTKESWNCLQTTAHNFAGVDIKDDLKITGLLGAHNLKTFDDVLYKSKANIVTGTKTFSGVTVDKDIIHAGTVNGLNDLSSDLILLADTKTAVGDFTFTEVEMKNLQVNGLIDGVTWSNVMANRLLRDQEQTITATYTFAAPTKKLHFQEEILGNGDEDNAELNGQKISSMRTAKEIWGAVGAVKVAAQVEANVLCQHVKNLNKAYLSNLNVDFFEKLTDASIAPADDFEEILQMDTVRLDDKVYLVVLSSSSILTARVTDGSIEDVKITPIMTGVTRINSAHAMKMATKEIQKSHDVSFFLLQEERLSSHKINTKTGKVHSADFNLHFGSDPSQIGCIDEISACFVALQDVRPGGKFRMRIIQMLPPVDSIDIWTGEDYSIKMDDLEFDLIMIKEKLYFAISDNKNHEDLDYLTLIEVDVTYPSQVKFKLNSTSTVGITEHDFVLIAPRQEPLIVAAKHEGVELIRPNRIDRPSLAIGGQVSAITRHLDGGVTVLKDGKEILHLEYVGLRGLKLDKRIYSQGSSVKSFTFLASPDKSRTLLLTANDDDKLHLLSSSPDTSNTILDFDCRDPEPHVTLNITKSDYCELNAEHTKCLYSTPDPDCAILGRGMSFANRNMLVEKINEYRRQISNGSLASEGIPAASNMREISWDQELAHLAELWAAQCPSSIDPVRKAIYNGDVEEFSQNIVKFKLPSDHIEESLEEVVKFWFNSQTDITAPIINNYSVIQNKPNLGYFTQLAWAKSHKIGCGWTQYQDEPGSSVSIVVCNFVAQGNVEGEAVYKTGAACSKCDSPTFVCADSLCQKAKA